jgi:predicted deoxyguanosinetriphosphate triphosphohydrolase
MNIKQEKEALEEITSIENSKYFQRLSEKTQVLVPMNGRAETVKSRLTHSYEVATSAQQMAISMAIKLNLNSALDIDYKNSLRQICLLHDLGHPPFGHDGADVIDEMFKKKGLLEGFSDNNNNFVILEKQDLKIRDYVKASIIKYPNKLYASQKDTYLDKLNIAIKEDKDYFSKLGINLKNIKTTITCQIMDEADRNSYTCSDLADFFCQGNDIEMKDIENFLDFSSQKQFLVAKNMVQAINSNSKNEIKTFFSNMKVQFNNNFEISEDGVKPIDSELFNIREAFSKMEFELFIKPIRKEKFHLSNIRKLKEFTRKIINGDLCTSTYYRDKINNTQDPTKILEAKRDMASEVNDWYIINMKAKLKTSKKPKQNLLK